MIEPGFRQIALTWAFVLSTLLAAGLGLGRLHYGDGLLSTFESDLPRYHDYTDFLDRFQSDGQDILILFEGRDMAEREVLLRLSDFLLDLQFVDGVAGVLSPLSLRVTAPDGSIEPLVPSPVPPTDVMQDRISGLFASAPELSRVLSEDRQTLLVMTSVPDVSEDIAARGAVLAEIEALAQATAQDAGMSAILTGFPVMRDRISQAIFDDMILLNSLGAVVGLAVAALSLRSLSLGLLATAPPVTSLLWVFGLLGFLGVEINVITVALPVLVLVLATSESIHISVEAARLYREGEKAPEIAAVRRVAPACILAALTTAAAFGALSFSQSTLISDLGFAGAIATLLSVFAVLLVHPLVFLTAGRIIGRDRLFGGRKGLPPAFLNLSALPELARKAPLAIAVISVAVLLTAAGIYSQIEPRYSLFGDLAEGDDTVEALRRIDAALFPTGALHVPVQVDSMEDVAAAQRAVAEFATDGPVLSLATLSDAQAGSIDDIAGGLPETLARRLVSQDGSEAVVSLYFPYTDSQDTRERTRALETHLATAPDPSAFRPATGLTVMASFVSHDVLVHLNVSFLIALLAAGALIALWLRRPMIAAITLIPNLLPIILVGAWLTFSGTGLEFAGGLALTIAFGIAVDDTVHVLNRLRLNGVLDRCHDADAVARATKQVSPALVITSLVLALGMTGTLAAQLVSVTTFGMLSIGVFVLALIADLLVLPACLIAFGRLKIAAGGGTS